MSILITNTSPLVALSAINRLDLLREVFETVLVPKNVYSELVISGQGWKEAKEAQQAINQGTWMQVVSMNRSPLLDSLRQRLGLGEAEAIALGLERNLPVFLDDLEARRTAARFGLQVIGSLGILKHNKLSGYIVAVKPIVRAMQDAGIYYSDSLLRHFLTNLGEDW